MPDVFAEMDSTSAFGRSAPTLHRSICAKLRKSYLEIALAVSVLALILQLGWPWIAEWWEQPRAGSLGIVVLPEEIRAQSLGPDALVYLPSQYHGSTNWPVVLYLHGAGDRGHEIASVRKHGLPHFLYARGSYPAIVAAPQCRENDSWNAEDLLAFLGVLQERFAVDENRVCVVGESMGGYGAWNLASYTPEKLAAVVPLCGGGEPSSAANLVKLPIWAFHGENDSVVPLAENQEMVNAVNQAGGHAQLTILPNRGHDLRDVPWKNPELIDWMLRQRREGDAEQ